MSVPDWRDVEGYEGLYKVSYTGLVKSLERWVNCGGRGGQRIVSERILSPTKDRDGYLRVSLSPLNRGHSSPDVRLVHKLVTAAFLGPQPAGSHIRHLNGDKRDNRVQNLAYGSPSENVQDMLAHGVHAQARKTECRWGHAFNADNTHFTTQRTGRHRKCRACDRERHRRRYHSR